MDKLQELLKDEVFLQKVAEVETPEELGVIFGEYNLQLEEGATLEEAFQAIQNSDDGELSEDDLADANGGIALMVGLGAVGAFTLAGSAAAFICGYASKKYGKKKKK